MNNAKRLALLISQATHHLHITVGGMATALFDVSGTGRVLFSNSALAAIDGRTLITLATQYQSLGCVAPPCVHSQDFDEPDDTRVYFILLDEKHVFVIISRPQYDEHVQSFIERLKNLLPQISPS